MVESNISSPASIQLEKNFALVYDTFCERLERLKTLHAQVLSNFDLVNELLQDHVDFLPAADKESIARLFDDPSSCLLVVGEVNAGTSAHRTPALARHRLPAWLSHAHSFLVRQKHAVEPAAGMRRVPCEPPRLQSVAKDSLPLLVTSMQPHLPRTGLHLH
jgi:hypothetical protein